jgi:hypothetical protein
MNIRQLIKFSQQASARLQDIYWNDKTRLRGGLGNGEAERSASVVTPDSGHRRVDLAGATTCGQTLVDDEHCRLVGFIPFFKGQ